MGESLLLLTLSLDVGRKTERNPYVQLQLTGSYPFFLLHQGEKASSQKYDVGNSDITQNALSHSDVCLSLEKPGFCWAGEHLASGPYAACETIVSSPHDN